MPQNNEFVDNLIRQAEENPVLALAVAAGLLTSASKLVNALAWKKEVARRVAQSAARKS